MINKALLTIGPKDIEQLMENARPESRTLDYKSSLPNNSWQSQVEFLQDVAAFANASGGDLIYGIEEELMNGKRTGLPTGFTDLKIGSEDDLKRRLNELVRTGIDPPLVVGIHHVDGLPQGTVVIVRVPASWAGPHMLTLYRKDILKPQFYMRHNVENLPMEIEEIRSAFNLSEERIHRLRRFAADRLSQITSNASSVTKLYDAGARVVLHLLPMNSSDPRSVVNIKVLEGRQWATSSGFPSWGGWSRSMVYSGFNFDGFLIRSFGPSSPEPLQYVQIFRSGALEAVRALEAVSYLEFFEFTTMRRVRDYLQVQRDLGVQLPIIATLTLWGAKDKVLVPPPNAGRIPQLPIDRDILQLPETVIDEFDAPLPEIFQSAFDALYQVTGIAGSPNYDEAGKWSGAPL